MDTKEAILTLAQAIRDLSCMIPTSDDDFIKEKLQLVYVRMEIIEKSLL